MTNKVISIIYKSEECNLNHRQYFYKLCEKQQKGLTLLLLIQINFEMKQSHHYGVAYDNSCHLIVKALNYLSQNKEKYYQIDV